MADQETKQPQKALTLDFLKYIPAEVWQILMPMACLKVGNYFKNKDANTTGIDDEGGNLLIAFAPVVAALGDGQKITFKKGVVAIRDWCNNYIESNP